MSAVDFVQIVLMAAAWGGSFLFLRMAVPDFGPIPLIAIRLAITALFLLPFFLRNAGWRLQFRENLGKLVLLGAMNAALPFPLFAYSTLYVTAGFASILNATAPLFAALVAWIWLHDRLRPTAVLGLAIGFAGVVVLVGGLPEVNGDLLLAMLAGLTGSLMYGLSGSFVKKHLSGVDSWVTTTGSFGIAALLLTPLAWFTWPEAAPPRNAWIAVALLAIVCTSVPNIYYFRLLIKVGPSRAMVVAFLIPAFGMLWGALALGERVTPGMLGGCAVILLGTALVTGFIGRRP